MFSAAVAGAIVPIADIRGGSTLHYSKGERMLRCKVASCYRLLDLFGWVNGMNNIITVSIIRIWVCGHGTDSSRTNPNCQLQGINHTKIGPEPQTHANVA